MKALLILLLLGGIYGSHSSNQIQKEGLSKNSLQGNRNKGLEEIIRLPPVSESRPRIVERVYEYEKIKRLEIALKGTPLEGQEPVFVEVAKKHGFDYRLLPSIAFTESTLCQFYNPSTFNCWGYGNGNITFESFEDAISTIGFKLVSLKAYEKWQKDKDNIELLSQTYCPLNQKAWKNTVDYFYKEIEKIEQK